MPEESEILDASTPTDAGGDAATMDAMAIAIPGYKCTEFGPDQFAELGISQEIAAKVAMVIDGQTCAPIWVAPRLSDECAIPEAIPMQSRVQFEGMIFVLEDEGGIDLQQGQLLYKAFNTPCDLFPNKDVKALGIQLKPVDQTGLSEAEIQVRIEEGDLGELLVRVHIWQGDTQVLSMTGDEFLNLTTGMQVLLDPESFELLEAFSTAKPDSGMTEIQTEEQPTALPGEVPEPPQSTETKAGTEVSDGGCNITDVGSKKPMDLGPLFTVIGTIMLAKAIGAVVRKKIGGLSLWEAVGVFFAQKPKS